MKQRTIATILATLLMMMFVSGCGGFARKKMVIHPDAPVIITEAQGQARISVYNVQENTLHDYGWVDLESYSGWTLTKFDWNEYQDEQVSSKKGIER